MVSGGQVIKQHQRLYEVSHRWSPNNESRNEELEVFDSQVATEYRILCMQLASTVHMNGASMLLPTNANRHERNSILIPWNEVANPWMGEQNPTLEGRGIAEEKKNFFWNSKYNKEEREKKWSR